MVGLKELLSLIQESLIDLQVVEANLYAAKAKGKHGLQDIMSKRAAMVKSKIRSYQTKLLNYGHGNILHINFRVIEENDFKVPQEFIHYYINITREEGEALLNYWADTKGFKIQILEIKDIDTHKSYKKL